MKVRFCPSPTGVPHVGLLRTALYNWYHAKHHNGEFIFRLEDTDDARNTEESKTQIVKALTWLGIQPNAGYFVKNGTIVFDDNYVQSNRNSIYVDILNKLIDKGFVYKSYSTKEEIDARNSSAGRPLNKGYDNFDREVHDETLQLLALTNKPFVYRFKLPAKDIVISDHVRGEVRFPVSEFVDFPVARSDGKFLYNFVNPVDDALMGVTDILRGEDLLPSTGKQVALWSALYEIGVTSVSEPIYSHLPYIMGSDKKKLSKRDSNSDFFHLVREGFIPAGLINYLMLLGWGQSNQDLFNDEELAKKFDVSKVSSNPAQFDMKKAMAINAEHIRLLDDEKFGVVLVNFLNEYSDFDIDEKKKELVVALAPVIKTRIQLLSEAVPYLKSALTDYSPEKITGEAKNNIEFVFNVISNIPADQFTISNVTESLAEAIEASNGVFSNKTVFRPLGSVLSGQKRFLPPTEFMVGIGKEHTTELLNQAL
jgi:glutamyl-tRNA synthetase